MAVELRLNDIGTTITVHIKDINGTTVDLSTATVTKNIIFKKPDGVVDTNGATFVTNGTDGQIYYNIQAGDLDVIGNWKGQANVVLSTGTWTTTEFRFKVVGILTPV